jgi:cyclomaltodextrinase
VIGKKGENCMKVITPEWVKDACFYQIFPDRFAKSRKQSGDLYFESWGSKPTTYGFKGGDLWGVMEHLDYLQDLGINAVYFNPIFTSTANHRYHTYDYFNVDPLLGGNEAFRELLDECHKRSIHVVIDGVFNHTSRGFWQFNHTLENANDSPYKDWFIFNPDRLNRRRQFGAYPTPDEQSLLNKGIDSLEAIGYRAWFNLPALPKFNTENQNVREFIFSVAEHWVSFGIDGWRLDVPNEIDDDAFWCEFRSRVKKINPDVYIVGEIWNEAQRWLKGDQFDAVMNYVVTASLLGFLTYDHLDPHLWQVGNYANYLGPYKADSFAKILNTYLNLYDSQINQVQLNLLDSHDTPRFLTSVNNEKAALKMGILFLTTFVGSPCVYYGDEIGLDGRADPDCRKAFPWDHDRWDMELLEYYKKCIFLRNDHSAIRRGKFQILYAEGEILSFARFNNDECILVILNTDRKSRTVQIFLPPETRRKGEFSLVFDSTHFQMDKDTLEITIPSRSGNVLIS